MVFIAWQGCFSTSFRLCMTLKKETSRALITGPPYANSMFPYENLWGDLGDTVWNQAYPESTVVEAASLKELWALQCNDFSTASSEPWGVHDHLRQGNQNWQAGRHVGSQLGMQQREVEARMHMAYQRLDPLYRQSWQHFMQAVTPTLDEATRRLYGIPGQPGASFSGVPNHQGVYELRLRWHVTQNWAAPNLSMELLHVAAFWRASEVYVVDSYVVNGFRVREGSWVVSCTSSPGQSGGLLSPCPSVMWFGRVIQMWVHTEREGCEPEPFLHVEWHETSSSNGCAYDAWIQAPLVQKSVQRIKPAVVSLREVHVLDACMVDHPRNADVWVCIARSWHVMSAVEKPCPWPLMMFYPWRVVNERQQ